MQAIQSQKADFGGSSASDGCIPIKNVARVKGVEVAEAIEKAHQLGIRLRGLDGHEEHVRIPYVDVQQLADAL